MTNPPDRVFGYEYSHNGKRYAFDIIAKSAAESKAKLESMTHAAIVGELKELDAPCLQTT